MNDLLICDHLSKRFVDGKREVTVLTEVSFSIQPAQSVAIVGSSGSGKSSLLHILGCLDHPSSGQVLINQQNIHQLSAKKQALFRNQYLGFIYQFHHLLADFTALENVAMPLLIRGERLAKAKQEALFWLQQVDLVDRVDHHPAALSGGERQRVAIARALINRPLLILADEPTGNLDQNNAANVQQIFQQLRQEFGVSTLMVTHDLQLAAQMDRQLRLQQGQLLEQSHA